MSSSSVSKVIESSSPTLGAGAFRSFAAPTLESAKELPPTSGSANKHLEDIDMLDTPSVETAPGSLGRLLPAKARDNAVTAVPQHPPAINLTVSQALHVLDQCTVSLIAAKLDDNHALKLAGHVDEPLNAERLDSQRPQPHSPWRNVGQPTRARPHPYSVRRRRRGSRRQPPRGRQAIQSDAVIASSDDDAFITSSDNDAIKPSSNDDGGIASSNDARSHQSDFASNRGVSPDGGSEASPRSQPQYYPEDDAHGATPSKQRVKWRLPPKLSSRSTHDLRVVHTASRRVGQAHTRGSLKKTFGRLRGLFDGFHLSSIVITEEGEDSAGAQGYKATQKPNHSYQLRKRLSKHVSRKSRDRQF